MSVGRKRAVERIGFDRMNLAHRCTALSDRLTRLAEKLNSDIPNDKLHFNDLGEIQGEGPMIDASFGRIMGKIEVLEFWRIDEK